MSVEGNAAPGAASAAANHAEPAPPLLAPTGNASLDVLIGDINDIAAPFQNLSDPEATGLDKASDIVNGILGVIQAPVTLLNDGFALATAGIAKLFPPLPAATLGMFHLGIPHLHTHPPAMPVPLPSLGPVALAGCVSVLINGIPAARAGDLGISVTCGSLAPPFEVFTGSSKVFIGGARAARMLDITKHCQPGAAAGKAMSTLEKVVSVGGVGLAVAGIGAEVLTAVDKAVDAKEGKDKKAEVKKTHIEPEVVLYEDVAVDYDDPADAAAAFAEAQQAAIEAAAAAQRAADEQAADEAALEQLLIDDKSEADSETAKFTGIQAGLDAAALALSFLMGMDPGMPPCFGAVLTGMPNVLVGGFPMPPWFAVARGLGKLGKGLKGNRPPLLPKLKCLFTGHPIDPVTGANVDTFLDHEAERPSLFRWERHYTSLAAERDGPMGRGFRHYYQRDLAIDLDCAVYTDGEGRLIPLPLPGPEGAPTRREGYVLERWSEGAETVYSLWRAGEPTMEFVRPQGVDTQPRLARMLSPDARIDFNHDALGRMVGMVESQGSRVLETRLILDEQGRILEVRRGPRDSRELPIVAAYAYDRAGSLVVFQDALGARATYACDAPGRIVRMTDRNGYSFHFTYDALGRCIEEHGDDGLHRVALQYEPAERRTLVTKADGGVWIHEYDERGTLVRIEDPHGGERRWVVDDEGRILEETGADGKTTLRFLYDEDDNHYGVADALGYIHPPLDEEPHPPDPLEHKVPGRAREQQWGSLFEELPARGAPADWLPVKSALGGLSAPRPRERAVDPAGRVVEALDVAGNRRAWAHDAEGNLIRYRDRDGREHRTALTSWNLVGAEIDPLGNATQFDYTPRARIARIVDRGGNESRYERDLKNRLVRVLRHGVLREEYTYDERDRLIEKRDGSGHVLLERAHGDNGLPSRRRLASGEVYQYAYDEAGHVTRASTRDVEVERELDRRGRLTRDERDGDGVRHRFDSAGLRATTYFGRFTVTYRQTEDGSLVIEAPGGGAQRLQRGEHESLLMTLGNGTRALSLHDHDGRCVGRAVWRRRGASTALWSVEYSYSAEGDLHKIVDNARGATEYAYDAAHRLIGEAGPGEAKIAFALDAAGNILDKPGLARAQLLEGNRLARAEGERFGYDARNHLAERITDAGEVTRYRYDSLDMLVEISWSGREARWTAGYDGLRRRLYKSLGNERTDYYWDGDRLAAEVGPTGALRIYVYPAPSALVPFMFIDYAGIDASPESGKAFYVLGNQIGAPLHIEDQEGDVVWRAEHVEPHGQITVAKGASVAYSPRFPGHLHDEETGLFYNRYRYYSPRLGRYLQSDPIGQSGGINLYAYPANPLTHVDVLGLMCADDKNSDRMSLDNENPEGRQSPDRMDVEEAEPSPPSRAPDLEQETVATSFLTEGRGRQGTGLRTENITVFWDSRTVDVDDVQAAKVPGQPTEREAVLFTVKQKGDDSPKYKLVTMHAPYHANSGAASQYMSDLYKAVRSQTKPFDNVDIIMGDTNTYGKSIGGRTLPDFKVSDISGTTRGKGESRLDKLIYNEKKLPNSPPVGVSREGQEPDHKALRVVAWNTQGNAVVNPERIGATAQERGWDVVSVTEPGQSARRPTRGGPSRGSVGPDRTHPSTSRLSKVFDPLRRSGRTKPGTVGEEHSDHKPIYIDLPAERMVPFRNGPTPRPTFDAPEWRWTPQRPGPDTIAGTGLIPDQPIVINGEHYVVRGTDAKGQVWVNPRIRGG
jgi:RHS repeat-associated protein